MKRRELGSRETCYEEIAMVQVRDDKAHRAVAVQEMLNVVATVDMSLCSPFTAPS